MVFRPLTGKRRAPGGVTRWPDPTRCDAALGCRGELHPDDLFRHVFAASERAETAIGSGDHPLSIADHGHRFLEPTGTDERSCSWQGTAGMDSPLVEDHGRSSARLARRSRADRSDRGVRQRPGRAAEPMGFAYPFKLHAATAVRVCIPASTEKPDAMELIVPPHLRRGAFIGQLFGCRECPPHNTNPAKRVRAWVGRGRCRAAELAPVSPPPQ